VFYINFGISFLKMMLYNAEARRSYIKEYMKEYRIVDFFFSGEGPRSRRYGRTAAVTLLVQPCEEDDNDDDYFLYFS
jgi:hypothetical protein